MSPLRNVRGIWFLLPALVLAAGHSDTARRLMRSGSPGMAIPEYQAALEDSPKDPSLWTELGEARLLAGQPRPAIKNFQKALTIDPGQVRAIRGLARALESSGETNRALLEWRRVASASQGQEKAEAETHVSELMKRLGYEVGEGDGSVPVPVSATPANEPPVKEGRAVVAPPAADADPLFKKGVEQYHAGQKDAAVESFRQVLKKRPGHAGAYFYAGLIRFEKNDAEKARFNLSRATGAYYRPRALYWLARLDEKSGQGAKARTEYRQALELGLEPTLANDARRRYAGLRGAGNAPRRSGSRNSVGPRETRPAAYPDTLRHLTSWASPEIPFPGVPAGDPGASLFNDALLKRRQRRYDDALESLRRVQIRAAHKPSAQLALLATGIVQYDMGLYDNAVASCDAFLREGAQSPARAEGLFVKALAQLRSGDPRVAAGTLGSLPAHTGFPGESMRLSALAQAQSLSGQRGAAAATLRSAYAVETNPVQRRSLALRAYREYQAAHANGQAMNIVEEASRGCDHSTVCLRLSVAKADLSYRSGSYKSALDEYLHIASAWPESLDAPWARYQTGNCYLRQGQSGQAARAWEGAARSDSYWGKQAQMRLEELSWRHGAR